MKSILYVFKGGINISEYKVIFHIDELNKWSIVLKDTINLLAAIDTNNFNIEVLANAEAVKGYKTNKEVDFNIIAAMEKLNFKGVKFTECNKALESYRIKEEDLMHFIDIVPAGVLELVNKQREGYSYIKP